MRAPPASAPTAILAALAVALLPALAACSKPGSTAAADQAPPVPPVKVQTAAAVEAQVPVLLVLTGTVVADQRSEVTADTQGKVLSVMIERGQRVKLGQAVVQLDVRSAALSAREAQANLASARAQRELAEQECVRTRQLFEQGAITRSEYDRQITQCTSALQQVQAAEARTAMTVKSVADGIVRAPFDGVVAERFVSAGEFVAPGRALFTLVDDDPLRVELSVPEVAVRSVRQGQDVEIEAVAAPGRVHKATITRLGAEIGRTRSLVVEATIAPGSELTPGMFVEARAVVGQVARPVVPESAVIQRGKTRHVLVVTNGEAQDRIVQVAPAGEPGKVAIAQGLAKGEKVVVNMKDQAKVIDGTRVVE